MLVWRRRPDRTFLLLLGLALVLAITLIAIMLLTTRGDQRGRPGALADTADAGTITVYQGRPPASGEDRPRRARLGRLRRTSDQGRPRGARPDPDQGTGGGPEPSSGGAPAGHGTGTGPVGGGSGGDAQNQGSGATTVGARPVEITVDPAGPAVTVSVGDLEVPIDADGLLP
jgi:hypothetical protein